MSAANETLQTAAGPLHVAPLSREALAALGELFPRLDAVEQDGRELLALVMATRERCMHGLRTGYGRFEAAQAVTARRAALFGRMRMPAALAAFRARNFDGVVLAGACVTDAGNGAVQEGELVFVHARRPLEDGLPSEPIPAWERFCGPHTTGALLTFLTDVDAAWKARGVATRTLTDMEPCPPDQPEVRWFADVVLAGGRVIVVRAALDPADPLLGALVEAGLDQVEFTPSAFVLRDESAPAHPAGRAGEAP